MASEIRWRNGPCHHPADHVARSGDKDRFARFRDRLDTPVDLLTGPEAQMLEMATDLTN